jgi:hypothetical protein
VTQKIRSLYGGNKTTVHEVKDDETLVKGTGKVQLFERAHSQNESNTESSGFKINFIECRHDEEVTARDITER